MIGQPKGGNKPKKKSKDVPPVMITIRIFFTNMFIVVESFVMGSWYVCQISMEGTK